MGAVVLAADQVTRESPRLAKLPQPGGVSLKERGRSASAAVGLWLRLSQLPATCNGYTPLSHNALLPDYFHSQTFDATLSLASVLCSNTPTVPASLASLPVAFVK
jgi:hypothetical protein